MTQSPDDGSWIEIFDDAGRVIAYQTFTPDGYITHQPPAPRTPADDEGFELYLAWRQTAAMAVSVDTPAWRSVARQAYLRLLQWCAVNGEAGVKWHPGWEE